MTNDKRGGKRPGSGRPKGPETVTLSYRVKASLAAVLDIKIKELISQHDKN